jgi:hypothetical protein
MIDILVEAQGVPFLLSSVAVAEMHALIYYTGMHKREVLLIVLHIDSFPQLFELVILMGMYFVYMYTALSYF